MAEGGTAVDIWRDCRREGLPSLVGRHDMQDLPELLEHLAAGRTMVASDLSTFPFFNTRVVQRYTLIGMHSFIGTPVVKHGRLITFLMLADTEVCQWSEDKIGLLEEVAERTWEAVERARSEAALRKSEADLACELVNTRELQEVSELLVKGEDNEALYERILCAAIAIMHADFASLQRFDSEEGELRLLGHKNFHPESARLWDRVALTTGTACGNALRMGERTVILDAPALDPNSCEAYRASEIDSVQSTPLMAREGRLIGMLSTHWCERHAPDETEFRSFDILVRQTADAFERAQAEAALQQSEARYRQIVEIAREYAIISLDEGGFITSWNNGAERLLGFSETEAVGRSGEMFFTTEDRASGAPERELDIAREEERAVNERWHVRKDDS